MPHDANSVVPKLMEAKAVSWPIGYAAMKDAEKLLTPKGLKRGFKSLGRIVSEETLIAKALELLEEPERQQTVIDATDRIKKATKKPIKLCRAAMKAADYEEARALKILKGEVEDLSGDMPVEEIKPAKEFTRLLGLCRQNDRDLAVVGVRRKKLTKREIAIRKEEARNEVYVGELDDCTLCWRYDGRWHRIEAPRWRYVNLWFDDGRLIYAANDERAASKIVTLTAPGDATETELPMTISGFRVGDTGMLATGANSKAPVWVCDRGGEWRDIGIPDGLAATGRYALAGSANHGYWVSWGPDLYRWHDGEWHAVTTRGTVYPKGWQGITTDGERVAAMHDGELWVGDVNLLKPVRLSKAPFAAWFEGKQLVVADTEEGLIRFDEALKERVATGPFPSAAGGKTSKSGSRGPRSVAKDDKGRMWQRDDMTWRPIPLVPFWEAVGEDELRWNTHLSETWLPQPAKTGLPKDPKPGPAPKPELTPYQVLLSVADGTSGVEALTADVAVGPDMKIKGYFFNAYTPLGYAAWAWDNPAMLEAMVAAGADVNGVSADGNPPLAGAVDGGRKKNIAWLLENGALPCLPGEAEVEIGGKRVATNSPLADAAYGGDIEAVRKMLDYTKDLSGLHIGDTPLMCAIERKKADIVALLREHNAPIRGTGPQSRSPLAGLFKVAPEYIRTYLDDLRDDFAGPGGEEALGEAMVSGRDDAQQEIDFLLEHGAVCKKWRGVTRAIDYDQMVLLERSLAAGIEADVTVVLTYALKRPEISAEAVRLLLTAGPALDNGDTGALFYAIAAKLLDVAQLLVEAGADLAKQHFDPANLRADPLTAVQHAERLGNLEIAEYLRTVRSP